MTSPKEVEEKTNSSAKPPVPEKEPTAEELQDIDTAMKRNLHLLGRTLFKCYQITAEVPKGTKMCALLLDMSAPYSTARSVQRQEGLMNQMQKDSERMTRLTT